VQQGQSESSEDEKKLLSLPEIKEDTLVAHPVHKPISRLRSLDSINMQNVKCVSFGGLGVACWLLVHKFAGSNPAESVRSSARLPSEGK